MRKILCLLVLLAPQLVAAGPAPITTHDRIALEAFVGAHAAAGTPPPFSFLYDGQPSAALFPKWKVALSTLQEGNKTLTTAVWTDPRTGLRATAVYTTYRDFPAIEWVVRFKNEGPADTPIIEAVAACDASLMDTSPGPVTLYRARGSNAERTDFAPIVEVLEPGAEIRFGPTGGRSSDAAALPFFNVAVPGRGVMAAVGWSGKWKAAVRRTPAGGAALQAGMDRTRFRLQPGEEVRTPSIALLFWQADDRLAGHNLFRRFVLAHHTPRPGGRPAVLPLSHGVGFGGPFPCNEYVCATESYALAMIDRLRQFDLEPDACWIDAGWYENAQTSWWGGVGNWTVNKKNFPRGLKPVADAAKNWGKGFVVWFEPERVYEGTRLDREHPEWVTRLPGNPNRLLNLGDSRARTWITEHISNFIRTEGVTIYRQDFNFDPAPFWQSMDAPDRVGIAEMKHIEGLYAYWDALLERHPGLLIDNCASGGRRIDLETMGRSVPLWRTDYSYFEPNGYQCHTYGLHLYVPMSGTGNNNPAKYQFRSSMNGAVVLGWEINGTYNNAPFNTSLAREDIAEFRALRPYFTADFYPLTAYSTSDEAWAAFQWDRPEERDGIVLAFRRPLAVSSTNVVALCGLDPDGDYEIIFEDYGITLPKTGRELMAGLSVKIPEAPGSLLIRYRRIR
jgi:alpha-galactosidase